MTAALNLLVAAALTTLLAACASDSSGSGGGGATAIDGPATWSTIYADYFAPTGAASCGGDDAGCHSSAKDPGAVVSNLVCTGPEDCYATMTGASKLALPGDAARPADAKLFRYLRTPGGTGKMPLKSSFMFQDGDIARIQDWIANGSRND